MGRAALAEQFKENVQISNNVLIAFVVRPARNIHVNLTGIVPQRSADAPVGPRDSRPVPSLWKTCA
jgi:hypothetical protein